MTVTPAHRQQLRNALAHLALLALWTMLLYLIFVEASK